MSLQCDFEALRAPHDIQRPVDPISFAVTASMLKSSVMDFFNRDLAYSGALFLSSLENNLPVERRAYLAEDAFLRFARTWDYLIQVLRYHLQLDRLPSRAIRDQLIGLSARDVEFLPDGHGGTWVQERWLSRKDGLRQIRARRQQLPVLAVTKDGKSLCKAISKQFVPSIWVDRFMDLRRSPSTQLAHQRRNSIAHVAPTAAALAVVEDSLLPGDSVGSKEVNWQEWKNIYVSAHRHLAQAITILDQAIWDGDRPRRSDKVDFDTRVLLQRCTHCNRETWVPLASAILIQEQIGKALCVNCGSWDDRKDAYSVSETTTTEVSEDVYTLVWRNYIDVLPHAIGRLEK